MTLFLLCSTTISSFVSHSSSLQPIWRSVLFLASDASTTTSSRRDFFRNVSIGTIATAGIVGNGIAVQGPDPYIPTNLENQVILITGANTGLGLESAKRLAAAGATLVLTARSEAKGKQAVQEVIDHVQQQQQQSSSKPPTVYSVPLDLCDFQSIREFPKLFEKTVPPGTKIDVLMNNAGVMAIPTRELTTNSYERTFQTNHLGPFALTSVLFPYMNTSNNNNKARIVNVSSMAYLIGALDKDGLDLNNLNGQVKYDPWDAYGKSKLENILFTKELQRRVIEKNIPLEVVALHPGAVRTDLARYILGEKDFVPMKDMDTKLNAMDGLKRLPLLPLFYFTKSVERGASCQIWLSAKKGQDVRGKFYQNCNEVNLLPAANDMDKAKKLWDMSEEMSGFQFNI